MALYAVSSAINSTLVPLLSDEVQLLRNVHVEVASIKAELESIVAFLKDADSSLELENERTKTWVKQVREMAYKIEDVMDEYTLYLTTNRQQRGFIGFARKLGRSISKLRPKHDIASQILDIKKSIWQIKERADNYGLGSFEIGSSSKTEEKVYDDPRVASLFLEEDEVVGIESTKEELIHRLAIRETNRMVTALVGMGGCGKTTLAKAVFDDQKVSENFDCRAWISVSQSYKIEDIFRSMVKQLCERRKKRAPGGINIMLQIKKLYEITTECGFEGIDTMDRNSLIQMLRELLSRKRFLIVFDDIWSNDFWKFIKLALPKSNQGSQIIITTRNQDVASFCQESSSDHIYKLEPLIEEEAWKLFCMKAFLRDFGGCCPPELKEVSDAIVKKCEGLPLAIVTIGALLSTKCKVVSEWQRFCDSLGSELERNPDLTDVTKIVLLSYHDLPYYLKPCFLYFGIIPEDDEISNGRLVRLWTAEGFIEGQEGKTMEEVAEEYLSELVGRSMVNVSEIGVDGRIRKCKVHDVVHKIILTKCQELSFCQNMGEVDQGWNYETRRWSLNMRNVTNKVLDNIDRSKSRIRSVFLFSVEEFPEERLLGSLASKFKLLKLLDLQGAPLDELIKEVGKLIHLRLLSVKRTRVKKIPKSIRNLQNLQTLNLSYSSVEVLESGILSKLHKLRHLPALTDSLGAVKIHGEIGHLEELQTLCGELDHNRVKELQNLRQLRKLVLAFLKRENGKDLCNAIEKMGHLRYLRVSSIEREEILDLHSISSPPESLQFLYLFGRLEMLPSWIPKLHNLVSLGLYGSRLTTSAMQALQELPNLKQLFFWEFGCGEQLYFYAEGFQKLKLLDFAHSEGLKSVIIEEGSLAVLEDLSIQCCPQLKEVPFGIQHLRELKYVCFSQMSTEFFDRIEPDKGQDYWAIEHIPKVDVFLDVHDRRERQRGSRS